MNNTTLGIYIPIHIKTITPLHIGGNEVLSPLADYWMDDAKEIHLINGDALAEAVYEADKTETYIKAVEEIITEKKNRMLSDFVQNTLKKEITGMESGIALKSFGVENPINIDCCIKTDGQPYIPGSSIKGAVRTAILQNWLNSGKPESEKALDDFLNALASFSKRSDLKKTKQADEIERVFRESAEEKLFGSLKEDKRLAASCLRINDTEKANLYDVAVYQLDRFNLLTGEKDIPILKQCIAKETVFSTVIYIDYYSYKQKTFHSIFKDIKNKPDLFALLNSVSLQVLNYEIDALMNSNVWAVKIKSYETFLGSMKERIEKSDNKTAYMRLGFGKLQFYQTIAMPIYKNTGMDETHGDWVQYLCYCNKMSDDIAAVYPSTRVLTSAEQEPLGWIELS